MQPWIVFAILAGLCSNLFNFLYRYILKDGEDEVAFGWFSETIRFTTYAFFATFSFKVSGPSYIWIILLAVGIVNIFSTFVFVKMHSFSQLSMSTIVGRTRLIWVPILAFLFLGEVLKSSQYIGFLVLFLGLSTAVAPHKILFDKGVRFAILSAFLVAVMSILAKVATPYASIALIMAAMSFPALAFPVFMKNRRERIRKILKGRLKLKILTSFTNIICMYFYLLALKTGPVSLVAAIYQGMMIFSVLAGIFILKEKEDVTKKIIGSIITLCGVLLLTQT